MQTMNQTTNDEEQRPLFTKSLNYRRSSKMDPKNFDEPPTDRQINYLKKLGFNGDIPKNRKEASDEIAKLLENGANEDIKCIECGNLTKKSNSINGKYCFKPDCRNASKGEI